MVVREEVEEGEEDGGRLLHAQEAVERPFAVELEDGLKVGGFAGEAAGGGYVLAGVVAFGGAGPEEEAALEGWGVVLVERWCVESLEWGPTYAQPIAAAVRLLAILFSVNISSIPSAIQVS